MGRLDRLRERVTGSDDPLDPPPSQRDTRSRLERLKSKVGADARAAGRAAESAKRELAKRARADVRAAQRAATPQNAAAVARRAGAIAANAEFQAAQRQESREQAVARRAEEAATAGPMLNASLAPTAPPQATESLLRSNEVDDAAGTELARFEVAYDDTIDEDPDTGGLYADEWWSEGDADADGVDAGDPLAWGSDDNSGDPLAGGGSDAGGWDSDWLGGGGR